jgi:hypothetical protein
MNRRSFLAALTAAASAIIGVSFSRSAKARIVPMDSFKPATPKPGEVPLGTIIPYLLTWENRVPDGWRCCEPQHIDGEGYKRHADGTMALVKIYDSIPDKYRVRSEPHYTVIYIIRVG